MLQEKISWCTSGLSYSFFVIIIVSSIFCPCTHVRANVPIRLPPPSPISSLIGIRLPRQAPSQSSTITVLPPLISNDQSSTTPLPTQLATGVIDIKPLPFGYGATDLNDEDDDNHSSNSNDDSGGGGGGEEDDSNDMHGKSGFGGARYYRGSRHDRNREKYKKQKSNSKTGHSATSGTGGSLKIDQGALHEHKQRETGHVDHDSHSNQDKFVKMIWDKGDGFVKRWHWDRGQKLKEAHSESEKKHLEHKDKAHSNELIERQKGEIAKKLANQGSKSNHLLDALDRQRSQAEGQLLNGFVEHEMNMHLKGPKKDHSIHGSLKRVRGNNNNGDTGGDDEEEDDDDRRSRKYRKYRNSKRSNPAIFKVEEETGEDDEDQSQDAHRRRKPSKSYRHNRIVSKFRRFPEGKLNEARKFFRGRNMIDSVTQAPEKDTETNVVEIEEKSDDNGDGDAEQSDNNSSDKTKVRKMKNSEEDEHPEDEEEKEDESERGDSGDESEGGKRGKKKVKKERDFQRKITIKEEKTELKAHERLEDPKESKNEDEENEDQTKAEDEEDEEKPRKKKVYYKGSRGSGFIKQIRATSNGRDPSKKFDTIIEGEVPIEEVEEESSESRTVRGDQARKANSVNRNQEKIKPLVRGDNISEIKIIKTAATNNQVRKNESPTSNSSEEPSQPHHHSPIILSPKPVNSISHLINPR